MFILNNLMFDVIRFQQQFLKRSMKIIKRYHKIKAWFRGNLRLSKHRMAEVHRFKDIWPPAELHRERGLLSARRRGVKGEALEYEYIRQRIW